MTIDEAIKYHKALSEQLTSVALAAVCDHYGTDINQFNDVVNYLTDYKRLISLEEHTAELTIGKYNFLYYENNKDGARIDAWDGTDVESNTINVCPMSYIEFTAWCTKYIVDDNKSIFETTCTSESDKMEKIQQIVNSWINDNNMSSSDAMNQISDLLLEGK